ncbi:P-loop containing nucleoside triphosphate hydrolase protein [Pseudomassariella vexata]|uniref:p-loop containing nucleoside triphosphate hydrolase protein n=1 Tax=Pseudomassariella vexata TaxID=1141098 RepID=A0A1Y2E9R7_9PEZI|nr:P-loop containing nucleoside triphosphate hydrolase protein [Pseudomassariella vexata]ORY68313.1 P-loop containing nucleoside triphosphate hydrolase protein [Pseudomassariella vexata]
MGFDGVLVGPVDNCKRILYYAGEKDITELAIYPLRFHKQEDAVAAKLKTRGRKFITSYGHKTYNGLTTPISRRGYQQELHGDIFVDFKTYYQSSNRRKPKLGGLRKTKMDETEVNDVISTSRGARCLADHEVDENVTETFMRSYQAYMQPINYELVQDSVEYLQLLPYQIPAYVFRTRRYVHVDVSTIAEIDKSEEARDTGFEDLVIPDGHRNLLIALIENHETGGKHTSEEDSEAAPTQIDIVRGKGRGLIILLHGPPGSGKTSTAETIAAYTRRPLYSITCGDLGTEAFQVERNLKDHTDRAHRWGCVLLLDEADVFLTRRDWRDVGRNALVSVFLRQLEYYSGILFLTTNRVGTIDEAFKSRVHVSLRYPRIELKETLQIWDNTLKRITRDNKISQIQIKFDKDALLAFAKKHYKEHEKTESTWNGRQIRNAFQTAIALGPYDRDRQLKTAGLTAEEAAKTGLKKWMTVKLTIANFRNIAKTAREFEDYLFSVRGQDSYLAKENQWRDDEHDPEGGGRVSKNYERAPKANRSPSGYLTPGSGSGLARRTGSGASSSKKTARRSAQEEEEEEEEEEEKEDADEEDIFEENLSDE